MHSFDCMVPGRSLTQRSWLQLACREVVALSCVTLAHPTQDNPVQWEPDPRMSSSSSLWWSLCLSSGCHSSLSQVPNGHNSHPCSYDFIRSVEMRGWPSLEKLYFRHVLLHNTEKGNVKMNNWINPYFLLMFYKITVIFVRDIAQTIYLSKLSTCAYVFWQK